jgi:two-component system KDP operon response regulator KdpE
MAVQLLVAAVAPVEPNYLTALGAEGFTVERAGSLPEAVRRVLAQPPDAALVIVDDGDAAEMCEVLRALGDFPLVVTWPALPPGVEAACLDLGADAAAQLPPSPRELAARVRAVLRRVARQRTLTARRQIVAGDLVLDLDAHQAWRRGVAIDLTPTEFQVLAVLAEHAGRVVTNRELLSRVWGPEYTDDVHYVRLYIGYLRDKLEDDPHYPRLLVNQWGVGYRLVTAEPAPAPGRAAVRRTRPGTARAGGRTPARPRRRPPAPAPGRHP